MQNKSRRSSAASFSNGSDSRVAVEPSPSLVLRKDESHLPHGHPLISNESERAMGGTGVSEQFLETFTRYIVSAEVGVSQPRALRSTSCSPACSGPWQR